MGLGWRLGKPAYQDIFAIALVIAYSALYMAQIGLFPTGRYPNWDAFWVDTRTMGGLALLREALLNGQLPLINPYDGLGTNLGGNHHSPLGIINLLVLVLSPASVMIVTQYLVIALGGVYSYVYLRQFSKNVALCLLGALIYISLPIVTSRYYFDQTLFGFLLLPIYIFHAQRFLETSLPSGRVFHATLLAVWSFFGIGTGDIFFLETLPATVFFYTFVLAKLRHRQSWFRSGVSALVLSLLCLVAGSYYLALLIENFTQNAASARIFVSAGLLPAVPEFVPQFFSFMFWNFAAKSFVLPLQGAGAYLYVPLVFYFIFGLGLFLTLKRGVAGGRDSIAVCGLLAAAIWPFVLMAIFYSQTFRDVFSGVSAAATGRIRHLWNIWPFFVTLATFVFAGKLDSRGGSAIRVTVWVLLSALAAAAIEYGLYFLLDEQISDPLYLISHANSSGLRSANAISLATLIDPWILLPFVNLFIVGTLAVVLNKGCWGLVGRHIYSPLAIVLCVISAFLFISIQNDLRLYQGGWQLSAANDYRFRTYLERNACINAAISRGEPNYRTLVSGAPQFGETGRNWKLIAETELNTAERHKTLYSWREIIDPYTTATLGLFTGKFNRRVEWSPTTDQVLKNFDTLGLIGVRWLISADQSVDDPRLTFRAECSSPPGPLMASGKEKEGGSLYVYELRDATPIAWLARRAEVATIASAARRIFVDREKPWVKGLALVDHLPSDYKNTVAPVAVGTARITRQTPLTMEIKTQSDESRLLVVSYTKRNNWLAYVDGKPVPVNDVYGGLIGVSIPAGQHDVTFVYRSVWLRWGAIGSLAAMLAPFLVWMIARRLKSRNGRGRRVAVQE